MNEPSSILQRIANFFRKPDTKYPYEVQPITNYKYSQAGRQYIAELHNDARKDRLGLHSIAPGDTYKNVLRHQEYVGSKPENVFVDTDQFLTANVTMVGPDGELTELTLSFPSGEQFNQAKLDDMVRRKTRYLRDGDLASYEYVKDAIIETEYYITYYTEKKLTQP